MTETEIMEMWPDILAVLKEAEAYIEFRERFGYVNYEADNHYLLERLREPLNRVKRGD